jgi:hypothetical protein
MKPVKRDIKRKVILKHASRMLMEIIVLVILGARSWKFFYFTVPIYIIFSLIRFYRSKDKYLVSLNLQNNFLTLTYVTNTLKEQTDGFNAETVLLTEIVSNGFVFKYPLILNIKSDEGWTSYKILDKQTATLVRHYLDVANISLQKQPLAPGLK